MPLIYRTDITLLKLLIQKSVLSVLSSDYYNENYHFDSNFPTIAYVFVFLIITEDIEIYLFPSINPILHINIESYRHYINRNITLSEFDNIDKHIIP